VPSNRETRIATTKQVGFQVGLKRLFEQLENQTRPALPYLARFCFGPHMCPLAAQTCL
jgi:hypothetical protein